MTSRIPPLLEPFLRTSPQDLVLLTSVLGASANWLVLRWLYASLARGETVVLCSFLRDWTFWKDGAAKLGLDLDVHRDKGRMVFVDGLTGLYCPGGGDLRHGRVDALEDMVGEGTTLVLDQVDAWMAMGGATCLEVLDLVTRLREVCRAVVVSVAADDALLHAQNTMLEKQHAAVVVSLAHQARRIMALRLLDTGSARDVSGVLRVTGGGEDGVEYLYCVGEGGVRVFERGA